MKDKKGPILITGVYRSGSTLIAQMMKNHKEVNLVYDMVNFLRFSYGRYDPIDSIDNVKSLIEEVSGRLKLRLNIDLDSDRIVETVKKNEISYGAVYDVLMTELLLKDPEASIWGEKTTLVWTKIPEFFEMFPHGRVICITRDPRAIVASFRVLTTAPGNDYLDAIFNCVGSMQKMIEYSQMFKDKRFIAIKYEDLVKDPEATVKAVCNKLDLEYEEAMLDTSSFKNKAGQQWRNNSMFDKDMKGISRSTVDKWMDTLEDWEVWLTEFFVGEMMDSYGYEKKKLPLTPELLRTILEKVQSSDLVTDGALRYLFTKKGLERFPMDPLDPKTWDREVR